MSVGVFKARSDFDSSAKAGDRYVDGPSGRIDDTLPVDEMQHTVENARLSEELAHLVEGSKLLRSNPAYDTIDRRGGPDAPRAKGARILGRYELLAPVGQGGMGVVYLAHDHRLSCLVAMKRANEVAEDTVANHRLQTEIQALERLQHPSIVPLYDSGRDDDGTLFFTMKPVFGETLTKVIDRLSAGDAATHEQWPLARRYDLFVKLLEALSYAHAKGVLHLDIKPDNIMVGSDGEVFLIDWGIASLQARTRGGKITGSPLYMSPEQARGAALDARSDIYSAFAVFLQLLTLEGNVRTTNSHLAVLTELLDKEPPARDDARWTRAGQAPIPNAIRRLVAQGLALDPSARIASAARAIALLRESRASQFERWNPLLLAKRLACRFFSYFAVPPTARASWRCGAAFAASVSVITHVI